MRSNAMSPSLCYDFCTSKAGLFFSLFLCQLFVVISASVSLRVVKASVFVQEFGKEKNLERRIETIEMVVVLMLVMISLPYLYVISMCTSPPPRNVNCGRGRCVIVN